MNSKLDFVLLFIVCAIWAGNNFVIKALFVFVDPFTLSFLRASLAGILILILGGYAVKDLSLRDIAMLSLIGLLNITIFFILFNVSLTTISAGTFASLLYTQPVFVAALSPLVGESLTYRKIAGVLSAFAGVTVILLSSLMGFTLVVGDFLALGSSLSWTAAILVFKKWAKQINTAVVTAIQLLVGAVFMLPVFALQKPFLNATPEFWLLLVYNVVLATVAALMIFWNVLSRMPASNATSYLFLVPTLTIVFGSILTFTPPAWNEVVGTALVAVGIVTVNR